MDSNSGGSGFIVFVYLLETTEDSSSVDLALLISTLPGVEKCVTHSYPEGEYVAFLRAETSSDKGSDNQGITAAPRGQRRGSPAQGAPFEPSSRGDLPELCTAVRGGYDLPQLCQAH